MEPTKALSENTLAFCRPWKDRVAAALFALLHVVAYPILWAIPAWQVPMTAARWYRYSIVEVMCLVIAVLTLYLAGPDDLIFDLNRRTYRYVFGWPLGWRVYEGPWEDMAAVCVPMTEQSYYVRIVWKDNKMRARFKCFSLGNFYGPGRSDRATRLAEETAAKLGLPLVERTLLKR